MNESDNNFDEEEMVMPENTSPESNVEKTSSIINGPLLLMLTVALIMVLGGMYFWFGSMNTPAPTQPIPERPTPAQNNEPESTTAEAQVETMQTTSTSDEISAIEADIEATDLDSLDAEMAAIEAEMEASAESN